MPVTSPRKAKHPLYNCNKVAAGGAETEVTGLNGWALARRPNNFRS
jgi:hypothetical protein